MNFTINHDGGKMAVEEEDQGRIHDGKNITKVPDFPGSQSHGSQCPPLTLCQEFLESTLNF